MSAEVMAAATGIGITYAPEDLTLATCDAGWCDRPPVVVAGIGCTVVSNTTSEPPRV